MAKRNRRRRRRGMGSIIRVRRLNGLGFLKGSTGPIMAPAIGGATAALTTLGVKHFIDPAKSEMNAKLVQWSWLVGSAAGMLASGMIYFFGGRNRQARALAMGSAAGATVTSLGFYGYERLRKTELTDQGVPDSTAEAVATGTTDPATGAQGFGAIVYQQLRGGMGAIVAEPGMNGLGSYGETVSLRGVNTSVFGTPGFRS